MAFERKYPEEYSTGRHVLLYQVWHKMTLRCDGRCPDHKVRYHDRGITVCEEWRYWPTFAKWALANGYAKGLELDRRDNDGNYHPENCRFVTKIIQNNNRDMVLVQRNIQKAHVKRWLRPFFCHGTGDIFFTQIEAFRKMGVDRRGLREHLRGKSRQVRGLVFSYIYPDLGIAI